MKALLLLLLPAGLQALSAGADFLRAEISARPAALGGAFAANNDDAGAFLFNPAALSMARQPSISATHFASIIDTAFDQATYSQSMKIAKTQGGIGISVMHSGTSDLNEIDTNGNDAGPIENGDWLLQAGYGMAITSSLSLGLCLKGFNSRLAEFKSRGAAVDLGMQSAVLPRLGLGLSFQNLGVQEAYDRQADPLPALLRLAMMGVLVDSPEVALNGSAQLDRPWTSSDPILFNLGMEYWYRKTLAFRAGYRFGADTGNLSIGTGIKWKGITLDYAYASMGDIGIAHRFTLGAELGTVFEMAKLYVPDIQGREDAPPPPRRVEVDPSLR